VRPGGQQRVRIAQDVEIAQDPAADVSARDLADQRRDPRMQQRLRPVEEADTLDRRHFAFGLVEDLAKRFRRHHVPRLDGPQILAIAIADDAGRAAQIAHRKGINE
jgi:hypothetical protein